jgi:hypothetical protein
MSALLFSVIITCLVSSHVWSQVMFPLWFSIFEVCVMSVWDMLMSHEEYVSVCVVSAVEAHTTWQRRPPPAFATTSTETIDFSTGFGFAALIYVSL